MNALRKAALAAILLGTVAPGAASANCFGSASTAKVCVFTDNVEFDPDGGQRVEDCVVVADPEDCIPVGANLPSAGTSGPLYSVECYACEDVPGVVGTVTGLVGDVLDAAGPAVDRAEEVADRATDIRCARLQTRASSYELPIQNVREFIASCT